MTDCQRCGDTGLICMRDEDGDERVAPCPCLRERNRAEFSGDYSPGGKDNGPQAALWTRPPPPDLIPAPGLTMKQIADRWALANKLGGRYTTPGATRYAYDRGLATTRTIMAEHCSRMQAEQRREDNPKCRSRGQGILGYRTTNREMVDALAKRGHPRCRRTVQRAHGVLKDSMAALYVEWIHKSGAARRPGELDCLEIRFRRGCVTPHLRCASQAGSRAGRPAIHGLKDSPAPTSSAERAPPDGGNGNGSIDREAGTGGGITTERVGGRSEPETEFVPSPELLDRVRIATESVRELFAAARQGRAADGAVPGDVRDGGGDREPARGGMGLRQDESGVRRADGRSADRPDAFPADGPMGGDAVGGEAQGDS